MLFRLIFVESYAKNIRISTLCLNKESLKQIIMLKVIYKLASFSFLLLFLISSIHLIHPIRANAIEPAHVSTQFSTVNVDSKDIDMSIEVLEDPNDYSKQGNESSNDSNGYNIIPDLGDDQVFPFVAGLDSYE